MILWTFRHTKPYNPKDVCYGRLDFDVSPTFPEESRQAIEDYLKTGAKPTRLFSSPLLRCLRLAEAVSEATGLAIDKKDALMEINFGTWEGQKLTAVPRAEMAGWMQDLRGFKFPQGESFYDVDRRVEAFLDSLDEVKAVLDYYNELEADGRSVRGNEIDDPEDSNETIKAEQDTRDNKDE